MKKRERLEADKLTVPSFNLKGVVVGCQETSTTAPRKSLKTHEHASQHAELTMLYSFRASFMTTGHRRNQGTVRTSCDHMQCKLEDWHVVIYQMLSKLEDISGHWNHSCEGPQHSSQAQGA